MYIHVSCVCIVASETYPPPKADGKENCKKKASPGVKSWLNKMGFMKEEIVRKFELWENEQGWRMKHGNI